MSDRLHLCGDNSCPSICRCGLRFCCVRSETASFSYRDAAGLLAVVPGSGSHPKFVSVAILGLDLDCMIGVACHRIRGFVSDHILVTNVIPDAFRDGIHLVKILGKIRGSTGVQTNRLQRTDRGTCALRLVDKGNYIDHRTVCLLQLLHGFVDGFLAGVVPSVSYHQKNSLLNSRVPPNVRSRGHNGVIERGAS